MITHPRSLVWGEVGWRQAIRFIFVVILTVACGGITLRAASLSITPSSFSQDYAGSISIQVLGLSPGDSVRWERFVDGNSNGAVDPGEFLIESFLFTDGLASVIGGVTNLNVPRDTDLTPGAITAKVRIVGMQQRMIGSYVCRLSSPTLRFAPIVQTLKVTSSAIGQSVTGTVRSGGVGVANAGVMAFTPSPNEDGFGQPVAGIVADAAGRYNLPLPAGDYFLWAFKSNYVADLSASPRVTLPAGGSLTADLNVVQASRTISGRFTDEANPTIGLPGLSVPWASQTGLFAIGFTDANGNFTVPVTPGQWEAESPDDTIAFLGYISTRSHIGVDTTAGNAIGVSLQAAKATALIYGYLTDEQLAPIQRISVGAYQSTNDIYQPMSYVNSDGIFTIGLIPGVWSSYVPSEDSTVSGYTFSQFQNVSVAAGQALRYDLMGVSGARRITGYLKDNGGRPISSISVFASTTIGTNWFSTAADTDSTGLYSLRVGNANWEVGVNCDGPDYSLQGANYQCVNNQTVRIQNNDAVVNFIAQPCGPLQVLTTSIPEASLGMFYAFHLEYSGCHQPFRWSLAGGNLPPDLALGAEDGNISGVPIVGGTYTFTVRVTDGVNGSASQTLILNVSQGLAITTTSLPAGTQGVPYTQQLQGSGGKMPYAWSLSPGSASLPAGLSLSGSGLITGIPTVAGSTFFIVRLKDNAMTQVDRVVGLEIQPPPMFQSALITGENLSLAWSAQIGRSYQVQFKSRLTDPMWQQLKVVTAGATTATTYDSWKSSATRFYRILLVP